MHDLTLLRAVALQQATAPAPTAPQTSAPGQGTTQPPPEVPSTTGPWIGAGVFAALVVFFIYALSRSRARRRKELEELEPTRKKPVLEDRQRLEKLPEQEREAELARLREEERRAEEARRRRVEEKPREELPEQREAREARERADAAAAAADAARVEHKRLVESARVGDAAAAQRAEEAKAEAARKREEAEALKARADEAAKRARDAEEERKKEEYRARKQAEADEKERRRREAEEAKARAEEEERRRAAEEAERRRLEEEEKQKKIRAEAGKTLAEGLARTKTGGFMAGLNSFLGRSKTIDESVLGELEEVLFTADIGVKTATDLLEFAREKVKAKDLSDPDKLKKAIRGEVERILSVGKPGEPEITSKKPFVIMVVGVNGAGKTTTIGKLASRYRERGLKVLVAAGDTFRAAATEQLEVWAQRAGVEIVKGKEGSDPGAVVFDAVKKGAAEGYDVVICDTAGRLHTKAPLMDELKRVKRVMDKPLPGSPHETLLILDSTNGQNAIAQAREFNAALEVTGIVMTKLDGTAKGGVIIGISDELKVPVRYVGIGEKVADLRPFDPREFVEALFD